MIVNTGKYNLLSTTQLNYVFFNSKEYFWNSKLICFCVIGDKIRLGRWKYDGNVGSGGGLTTLTCYKLKLCEIFAAGHLVSVHLFAFRSTCSDVYIRDFISDIINCAMNSVYVMNKWLCQFIKVTVIS